MAAIKLKNFKLYLQISSRDGLRGVCTYYKAKLASKNTKLMVLTMGAIFAASHLTRLAYHLT